MEDEIFEEEPALDYELQTRSPVIEEKAENEGDPGAPEPAAEPVLESADPGMVPDAFIRDLRIFGESIRKNPGLVEQIRDVFEYHLVDPTDRRTFSRIVNALTMILGHNATMIVATACHINAAPFFEDIRANIEDNEEQHQAISVLQHLTALYGSRIQEAYALSVGLLDEDWFTADINTYRREGEAYWMTDLSLALYNGTHIHLKMTPESLFQLTLIMMKETGKLPPEAFDPDMTARYGDDIRSFAGRFIPKKDDGTPPGYA